MSKSEQVNLLTNVEQLVYLHMSVEVRAFSTLFFFAIDTNGVTEQQGLIE